MNENENPYAPPAGDGIDDHAPGNAGEARAEVYVVSLTKFYLLASTTFGLYKLYWFYAQFRDRRRDGVKFYAALAAFFSVFTAHSLFRSVDLEAQAAGLPASPRATNQTVPYIVLAILVGVVRTWGKQSLALSAAGLGVSVLSAIPLARVQGIVNRTARDPQGHQNSKFSALNIVTIALGVALSLAGLVGIALESYGLVPKSH
jgi:hypothetical protein